MFGIEEKTKELREEISKYKKYSSSIVEKIDSQVSGMELKAKEMISGHVSGAKLKSAAQCLGMQLPIPDLDEVFEKYILSLKDIADGNKLDVLLAELNSFSNLPESKVMEAMNGLSLKTEKACEALEKVENVLENFTSVQEKMKETLSIVSSVAGCIDNSTGLSLNDNFKKIESLMETYSPDFKSGLDCLAETKKNFSDPSDILNDLKARMTGELNLDGEMKDLKARFEGLGGL